MDLKLLKILGQGVRSSDVVEAIRDYELTETQDDPPFVRYLISRKRGLELLTERDVVVDIQIFVQSTKRFSAFSEPLPFGLASGMSQSDVHRLLGSPAGSDKFDSKFDLPQIGALLTVCYDDRSMVKYLSIGTPLKNQR